MAASKRTTASARERTVRKQIQQRNLLLIGLAALVIVVVIGSVAAIGRQSTDAATTAASQPVNVFTGSAPANAEQNGQQGFSAATLTAIATQLGLDTSTFGSCLSSGKYTKQVDDDYNQAIANGVTGTPTFVINGMSYVGPKSTAEFRQIFGEVAPGITFE